MALTDVQIRNAKPGPKTYKLADSNGLFLQVTATSSKLWRMKFRHNGKEGLLSFGPYPLITLADAREKRDSARRQMRDGLNPALEKKRSAIAAKAAAACTFAIVAEEVVAKREREGLAATTAGKLRWYDPHEISLDENVTRTGMHPADQFEAFRRLSEERGFGAEEIGARFGVGAQIVRQRLRLGAVSPTLMALYRGGGLTLDQMMAYAVSEDHARQEQVLEQLGPDRPAYLIRRTMTETKVTATDRRAIFVGAEAYGEAGGTILRDLFTEDGGGWFEDPALLDRLVAEKLAGIAQDVRDKEGWKWAEAHIDYPRALGLARVYPHPVERSEGETAKIDALSEEYDALVNEWDAVEELPPEVEARFAEIDAALEAFGDGTAFDPDDIARGGVFVILGQDGVARVERGLIRPEDVRVFEPEAEPEGEGDGAAGEAVSGSVEAEEADEDAGAPLSERLVLDLTAHRTLALRDALAEGADGRPAVHLLRGRPCPARSRLPASATNPGASRLGSARRARLRSPRNLSFLIPCPGRSAVGGRSVWKPSRPFRGVVA